MSACEACLRRTALVSELAGHLDHLHAERGLMDQVFALGDDELAAALVGDAKARGAVVASAAVAATRLQAGSVAVCGHAAAYPVALRDLSGPPAVLFANDSERLVGLTDAPAVAIVGARRASAYGLEVARSLGRGLSAAGVTVVSGMALGVDSAAHEGALDAGGRTIAVLGGGVDVPYPATKRSLHARLRDEAVVVSELPPGFRPRRWTFPARNRIIAALAAVAVVIEAADRSGALITARVARDLGRDVAAVPGRVTSPLAAGPNGLLRDGAHVVDGAQSVLDLLFGVGVRSTPPLDDGDLDPRLRAALRAVREGRDPEVELPSVDVLAALGELELRGLVRRARGGGWVAVA